LEIEYPITFLYFRDLAPAVAFFQDVLRLSVSRDQGWCMIFAVGPQAHVGLVDEKRGSLRATRDKAVLFTLVVDDVEAWHDHLERCGVANLTPVKTSDEIRVRGFFFDGPEGYRFEVQRFLND